MSADDAPSAIVGRPAAMHPAVQVLCEDGPLLAVFKPAGLATQAPPSIPSLEGAVKAWLKDRHGKPGNVYLGVPHRLDRPASGVVVFAKNSKAAARLAEQFQQRRVRKTYRTVVEGTPSDPTGPLVDWLRKCPDEARTEIVPAETPGAKQAVLRYRTLGAVALPAGPGALLEIDLETGRMHQIRVQLASRGWPVVGDAKYGARTPMPPVPLPPALPRDADDDERSEGQIALHAHRLTLLHPIRYDEITITAPPPLAWNTFFGNSENATFQRNSAVR